PSCGGSVVRVRVFLHQSLRKPRKFSTIVVHEGFGNFVLDFVLFVTSSFENRALKGLAIAGKPRDFVIPAWSAGIQADMDVSGRILRIWMPAIHAGMTEAVKPLVA
ncbi:MAG: hypothetical protein ACREQV_01085, partial [Candidatus Binatia bacterium]